MPTYFGYVEREADNYVNWADVSKDITSTVNEIQRVRDEKKQALDDDYRAELKNLTLQPKGQDETANKYMTEYGDNASNFLMMQNRLLKQGHIKVKDYVNAKQNLSDGTDNLFQIMKDYQANYAENMERYKNQISSSAEPWMMKQVEKFADFGKSGAYIGADGSVSVAMKTLKNVNGQNIYTLDTNPGEVASLSVLKDAVNTKIDRYDANTRTTELAKTMGLQVESLYVNGVIASIEDITKRKYGQDPLESVETLRNAIANLNSNEKKELTLRTDEKNKVATTAFGNEAEVAKIYQEARNKPEGEKTDIEKKVINFVETKLSGLIEESKGPKFEFDKAETKIIKAALPTPEAYMSVLTDNKQTDKNGTPYEYRVIDDVSKVEQLTKENPNVIYMAVERGKYTPVLSEAQKGEAVEFMRELMRAKYTLKEVDKGRVNAVDVGQGVGSKEASPEKSKYWAENRGIMQVGNYMANLYNGNKTEINTALSHFGNDTRIYSMERNEDGIYINYKDPEIGQKFIPFFNPDGTAIGTDNFLVAAKKALLYPENWDLETAKQGVKNKSLMPNMEEFNMMAEGQFTPTPEKEPGFFEERFPALKGIFPGDRASKIVERTRINQTTSSGGGTSLNASTRKK